MLDSYPYYACDFDLPKVVKPNRITGEGRMKPRGTDKAKANIRKKKKNARKMTKQSRKINRHRRG